MKIAAWLGGAFAAFCVVMALAMASVIGGTASATGGCAPTASLSLPASGHLSQAQIRDLWVEQHGPPSQSEIAGAVGMAESQGDPDALGPPTQYGRAVGVMQILGAVLPGDLRDPHVNMRNAIKKWRDARGWTPWTTYTSGLYLKYMGKAGPMTAAPVVCVAATGPGSLSRFSVLYQPASYADLPGWAMAAGRQPEQVDARILPDAEWVLRTYHLIVTAARETGHHTHGDGTAMDMVPVVPYSWDATALRLAHDLGWTESCAASGVAPVCHFVPAIRGVFYNSFPGHGDPQHCSGGCGAHIHVSWYASHYGASGLAPPNTWVRVFPVG